ncbi:hypothetical protein Y1Q_0012169 [Alligator mississippiensis]|uniref:Uncharacterized protein n=1 Tax=Alligator mississippiensis TaxID=8496 RepID=A0A151N574_ALLMI|nr:hypothetical protein Y1Q_0012169 [Alligator mississippiensis]
MVKQLSRVFFLPKLNNTLCSFIFLPSLPSLSTTISLKLLLLVEIFVRKITDNTTSQLMEAESQCAFRAVMLKIFLSRKQEEKLLRTVNPRLYLL